MSTTVEGHELHSVISLDTPWEELSRRPEFQELTPIQLKWAAAQYRDLQASVEDNDDMLPWFPFQYFPR